MTLKPGFIYVFGTRDGTTYEGEFLHTIHGVHLWRGLFFSACNGASPRFVKADNIEWVYEVCELKADTTEHDYNSYLKLLPT